MRALVVGVARHISWSSGHIHVSAVRGRGEPVRGLRRASAAVGLHLRGGSVLLLLTSRVSGVFE